MYLWQDQGIFGVFDPESGWCRVDADGAEPGGWKGVVCDVLPGGMDLVGYLAVGFIAVVLTGFYLWYWPGVRRWAAALAVRRRRGPFAFTMSLHKVDGLVVWVPLLAIAVTGAAFAFPNLNRWYETVTPAQYEYDLWVPPESSAASGPADSTPLDLEDIRRVLDDTFPGRTIEMIMPPFDETATYTAWVTRGYSPWTREGGAGNVLVSVDQYTGEVLDDATPEDGNVFDQDLGRLELAGAHRRLRWHVDSRAVGRHRAQPAGPRHRGGDHEPDPPAQAPPPTTSGSGARA